MEVLFVKAIVYLPRIRLDCHQTLCDVDVIMIISKLSRMVYCKVLKIIHIKVL